MAADDPLCNEPLLSVEFEVFGKVQGKSVVLLARRSTSIRLMLLHLKPNIRSDISRVVLLRLRGPRLATNRTSRSKEMCVGRSDMSIVR